MTPLEIATLGIIWLFVFAITSPIVLCWVVLLIGHLKGYPDDYTTSDVLETLIAGLWVKP